MDAYHDAIVN